MMFELTITAPDIDGFVRDPRHPATAEGYVLADQFGGRLPVERGWFNLFVRDSTTAAGGSPASGSPASGSPASGSPARKMLYRLWLRDPGGTPLTFVGHKDIRNEAGFDVWPDTTTLFVTVLEGHVPPPDVAAGPAAELGDTGESGESGESGARVAGAGILYIRPLDFARQLTTFRASGPAPASALASFGNLFLGQLWHVYGPPLPRVRFPLRPAP
jgi:cholesterol oxidase